MKHIILFIFYFGFSTLLLAQHYSDEQDEDEIKSLIGKHKELTGFGNIDFRIGNLMESQVLIMGGYGGILINKNVMLGVAAYGLTTKVEFEGVNPKSGVAKDLNLHGGYAGLLLGFKIWSKEIIHLSFPTVIGGGQLDVSDPGYFTNRPDDSDYTLESSAYFLFEPSALLEINISNHFRLGFGAGYRIVKGLNLENVEDSDM